MFKQSILTKLSNLLMYSTDSSNPLDAIVKLDKIECGVNAATYFAFEKGHRNLNHGSFGTYPIPVRDIRWHYQLLTEENPDKFIRYTYPKLLDQSRTELARYLNAPTETCVFVPNATTAVNTVLRNLVFEPGDVIVYFSTIYGACEKTITYLTETTPVQGFRIELEYPLNDAQLCAQFEETIISLKHQGKRAKVAVFDTISSQPGVRVPFERLTSLCKEYGVVSCIDGAHSIGQIPVDLSSLDPDFYTSNCHKGLHVPRACAVLYVPIRNQHLIRSTLPTSHGFVTKKVDEAYNPLPLPQGKSSFVYNFEYVGTLDNTPYLCIPAALAWRSKCVWNGLRGEDAVMGYCEHLARVGGDAAAKILGTEVMENEDNTLRKCAMVQIRLPIKTETMEELSSIARWSEKVLNDEYHTFIAARLHAREIWIRLSAQVYLTLDDFEWAGRTLKELCARIEKGEWKSKG